MWIEIAGAVFAWAIVTIAIAEWFALRKLMRDLEAAEDECFRLRRELNKES